ncbi:hypothetical protein F66182_5790 [Fusarium sp. NRRL 66182]|nr:hypothetical protein F66182_5790 [Fusarium sp. NRRL 66182]
MSCENKQLETVQPSTDLASSSKPEISWHRLQTIVYNVHAQGRLIIVGDVHGHLPELKLLLQKVSFSKDNGDHLIFVGDLINKGPDSPGVVQLAMDLGASAIRGNNEDRVLAARTAIERGDSSRLLDRLKRLALDAEEKTEEETVAPVEVKDNLKSLSPEHLKPYSSESDFGTAAELSREQISWLSWLPLILRIKPPRGATHPPWNAGTLLVVHGGLVPSLPLEQQDPWAVMNMRGLVYPDPEASVTEAIRASLLKGVKSRARRYAAFQDVTDEHVKAELARLGDVVKNGQGFSAQHNDGTIGFPLESRQGEWWIKAWSRWQNAKEDPEKRSIVVYGHDARAGLQVGTEEEAAGAVVEGAERPMEARYTFGLDSGCVYGNCLSAMVIDKKADGEGLSHSIVQVDAIKEQKQQ